MSDGEILILEDEALIAMDIEMTLASAGYENISVHHDVDSALEQIETSAPVAAFLDFNLGRGKTSLPVAQRLKSVGIPFIFLTGYTDATVSLPEELTHAKRVTKPFHGAEIVSLLDELVSRNEA